VNVHILPRFQKPRGDIIQGAAAAGQLRNLSYLFALGRGLVFGTDKWRVAQYVTALIRWQYLLPVKFQRIATDDMRGCFERDADKILAKGAPEFDIHDMVHHP